MWIGQRPDRELHSEAAAKTARVLVPILLASILTAPAALLGQAGRKFKLLSLHVIGSTRHGEAEVMRATGLKLAEAITLEGLKEAADRLAATGVFSEVDYRYQTQDTALTAQFVVKDTAQLLPCSFDNFVWFSREELLNGLRSQVPLFDGQVPPGGQMQEVISSTLSAMLKGRGIHAQVQATPTAKAGGPVEGMQFKVVGVAIPIRKIEFTGVQKVDPALLQEAARPVMDKDFDAAFFKDFSEGGVGRVYRQRGYLRAGFGDPIPQLLKGDEPPNSVSVTVAVTEGEQYRLKEIIWSGESAIPYAELAKTMHVAPGSPVDALQLEQDVLALPWLFRPKGYLDADAEWKPILDDATHTASYQIRIIQGDLYRLGKLEIAGLDEAHVRSLERLCRLRPGDPYDSTYWSKFLQESARHLPPSASGWKAGIQSTAHKDAKTVDVKLTFLPAATR